jgi:ADP-ribose pyrophosphatase YjhB (NUDIX family)
MTRQEYYRDPSAPPAQSLLVTAHAVTRNGRGQVLLVRRVDNGRWELPGGRVEVSESPSVAVRREVNEEAGLRIEVTALAGIYSEPDHIVVYPGGAAFQLLSICFHAVAADDGPLRPDRHETSAAAWFDTAALTGLGIHPAMRRRLVDALSEPERAHYD